MAGEECLNIKPNLYIVTEVFYPEDTSTSYILTQIAKRVAKQFKVTVICGPADYHEEPRVERAVIEGISIRRVKLFRLNKNIYWQRIIRLVVLSIMLSFRLMIYAKRKDKVLIVTNPAPMLIIIGFICSIKSLRLSVLAHDVFPENLVAANLLKKGSFCYSTLEKIFNLSYSKAENIIVLGRDMEFLFRKKLQRYFSVSAKTNVTIIENWADVINIIPQRKVENKLVRKLGIQNKIIFQFAGNLGRLQGLEILIRWIRQIDNDALHFVFLGEGAVKKYLVQFIKENNMHNVSVVDGLPRKQQQLFLNACDVSIVSLASGMRGLGVPSKTYNVLASGKPILYIGEKDSEVGYLISENKNGWIVPPGEFDSFKSVITQIAMMPMDELSRIGMVSRNVAVNKYSEEWILGKFENLLYLK